jgi:hypothetical protein
MMMFGKAASALLRLCVALAISQTGVPAFAAIPVERPTIVQDQDLDLVLAALSDPGRQTVDTPNTPDTPDTPDTPNTPDNNRGQDKPAPDVQRLDVPLSDAYTRKLIADLRSIRFECGEYDPVYRIDCLRQGIDMIVASMPDNGEYSRAKIILRRASGKLAKVVRTYADKSVPKLVAPRGANPRFKKRRSYTAVRRVALPTATAQAAAIVQEAATQLLRSSENSERRYAHYQQISVAVDSTKVLLRSG